MNVILLYQHIGRELFSIRKLAGLLKSNQNNIYIYSIDFELNNAIRTAKKTKIDIVVSPWLYHSKNYEEFVPFIKLNPKVKLINLHAEQIFAPFSRIAVMPSKGVASDCVYHFCWSRHFCDSLIEDGVSPGLCYITGNMRNDEAFETKYDRIAFSRKYNLQIDKKWILFAENRNFVNSGQGNNSSFSIKGVDSKSIENRIKFYKETLQKTIEDLNQLPESFFLDYELIYRAHPGFQGNMGIVNKHIKEISEYSIYEWLNVSDICVVWNSTTAFESDVMGVPVFICSPVPILDIYRTIGLENYKTIFSIQDLRKYNIKQIREEQRKQENYKLYLGDVDGNATSNVANAITDVYKRKDGYTAKLIPMKWSFHVKKSLSVKVLKLLIKMRLFDILKYPRSAYQHKNDIPFYPGNI